MWKYYLDVTGYNFAVALLSGGWVGIALSSFTEGLLYGGLIFSIFGTGLGVLAFNFFQSNQYYFYHNLGFTRKRLMLITWAINLLLGIPIIGLALFLDSWLN